MGYAYIMKIQKNGSSMKQIAYARRVFGAQGTSKKNIALDVGYSKAVSNSIKSKIESRPGFNNAMAKLAVDSNNLVLEIMSEFKARGFEDYSNKDLNGAMNAITNAWTKFNGAEKPKDDPNKNQNRLRTVILQRVDNQVVNTSQKILPAATISEKEQKEIEEVIEEVEEESNPEDLGF